MPADAVFTRGKILTLDPQIPAASAIAVRSGRVAAVGDDAVLPLGWRDAAMFDLKGLLVVPGFVDAHSHVMSWGLDMGNEDLSGARSIAEILAILSRVAARTAPGRWVVAARYNHLALAERRHPSRVDLDRAVPGNPCYVRHISGHAAAVNSIALEMAGISRDTRDPDGGAIERDPATGEPTGVLAGSAQYVARRLRLPHRHSEMLEALRWAGARLAREGVTTVHEAGAGRLGAEEIQAYREAVRRGIVRQRVHLMMRLEGVPPRGVEERLASLASLRDAIREDPETARLSVGPLKFFADGSILAGTAALSAPVGESRNGGRLKLEELAAAREAAERGWPVAVHAIGDLAIDAALDCLGGAPPRRPSHRIEHCSMPTPGAVSKMRGAGVTAVLNPSFLQESGEEYARLLGLDAASGMFPARTLLGAGVNVCFGIDRPASTASVIDAIHDAVNRLTRDGTCLGPDERISPLEAIKCVTVHAAAASGESSLKGALSPGMVADFVVLSDDITAVDRESIRRAQVVATVVDGAPVFADPGLGWDAGDSNDQTARGPR